MDNLKPQHKRKELTTVTLGILGGFAAVTAEACTFPLDNIKTRMQMNGRDGAPQYKSLRDCISYIHSNLGIKGFYKGSSAAFLRQLTYSSSKMMIYEKIKRIFSADVDNVGFFRKLLGGGIAGAIGCVIGNPADILKIRLINDINGSKYNGLIHCFKLTREIEGYSGFLKGLNVNITRAIIVNASELATYDQFKILLVKKLNMNRDSTTTHFAASFIAGFFGALCSSPADVVKTRFMNELKTGGGSYTGAIDCAVKIFKNEGPLAFYKGFVPYFMRNGPWVIFFFVSYEKFKYFTFLAQDKIGNH